LDPIFAKQTPQNTTMTVKDDPKEPESAVGGAGFASALDAPPEPVAFGQLISSHTKLDAVTGAIFQDCDTFLIQCILNVYSLIHFTWFTCSNLLFAYLLVHLEFP
jgi:hypothetical protein